MKKIISALCLALLIGMTNCTSDKQNANAATSEVAKAKKKSTRQKAQTEAQLPIIIDFYADWCGPCRQFKPVFEDAKKRYNGKILFQSIDVDKQQAMAEQFGIQYLPTVVFLDANGKELTRHTGYMNDKMFDEYIEKLLK